MKKLILFIAILFCGVAHAGPMANVEYVHKVIEQQWGIDIPYNPALENPHVAANMKYLLTAVDVANKMLNNEATTSYGEGNFATMAAADTVATNEAVKRLIKYAPKFWVTTTDDTSNFSFTMSAKGKFTIYWGDGSVENIIRTDITEDRYSHTYDAGGEYTIGIGGQATEYATEYSIAVISFRNNKNVAGISGSLGTVYPTIDVGDKSGQQPRFYMLFNNCTNLAGKIPTELFAGVHGKPAGHMFNHAFAGCGKLSGAIPAKLFGGISGAPAASMFDNTFSGCGGLEGAIPENLFAGVHGKPASYMFNSTFSGCSGLSSTIPENLFGKISGAPATYMFTGVFDGCSGLSGTIPEKLFAGIEGAPASAMFNSTFSGCSGLSGSIPGNLFAGIEGAPASAMFNETFSDCNGLSGTIPGNLFGKISGVPAKRMFNATFQNCSSLTGAIPENLFAGISGTPAELMFSDTFNGCRKLESIPVNLFGDISGDMAADMFTEMFAGCTGLTGPSARINRTPLYEIWPDATQSQVGWCYNHAKGLSDYADIPSNWK